MTAYRVVAEVHKPTDDYGYDFATTTEVFWQGDHHPLRSELPEFQEPEPPIEQGPVYLQRQRFMHLGWKAVHASVERI